MPMEIDAPDDPYAVVRVECQVCGRRCWSIWAYHALFTWRRSDLIVCPECPVPERPGMNVSIRDRCDRSTTVAREDRGGVVTAREVRYWLDSTPELQAWYRATSGAFGPRDRAAGCGFSDWLEERYPGCAMARDLRHRNAGPDAMAARWGAAACAQNEHFPRWWSVERHRVLTEMAERGVAPHGD